MIFTKTYVIASMLMMVVSIFGMMADVREAENLGKEVSGVPRLMLTVSLLSVLVCLGIASLLQLFTGV